MNDHNYLDDPAWHRAMRQSHVLQARSHEAHASALTIEGKNGLAHQYRELAAGFRELAAPHANAAQACDKGSDSESEATQ